MRAAWASGSPGGGGGGGGSGSHGAIRAASLGKSEMVTFLPAPAAGGGMMGGEEASSSSSPGDLMPPLGGLPQHELSPTDDAALAAMSDDLLDLFGDGTAAAERPFAMLGDLPEVWTDSARMCGGGSGSGSGMGDPTAAGAASGGGPEAGVGAGVGAGAGVGVGAPAGYDPTYPGRPGGKQPQPQQQQTWARAPIAQHPVQVAGWGGTAAGQASGPGGFPAAFPVLPQDRSCSTALPTLVSPLRHQAQAQPQPQQRGLGSALPYGAPPPAFGGMAQQPLSQPSSSAAFPAAPQQARAAALQSRPRKGAKRGRGGGGDSRGSRSSGGSRGGTVTGPAPPDNEDDGIRRRRDRNTREQQRSQKISTQIDVLRDVLKEANVGFKSDKHSTLVSVTEYIRTLQNRKALLDEEHARLLTTIRRTSDAVLSGGGGGEAQAQAQAPPSSQLCPPPGGAEVPPPAPYGGPDAVPSAAPLGSGSESGGGGMGMAMGTGVAASASLPAHPSSSSSAGAGAGGMPSADEELLHFVRGLDYRSIFSSCGIAMAIAAVDGRLVDCNEELVALTGRTRRELVGEADGSGRKMSLFNLVGREGMESVFGAMSRMLKVDPGPLPPRGGAAGGGQHTAPKAKAAAAGPERSSDHWSGIVEQQGTRAGRRLRLNMSLVRSGEGRPKFFNCALAPDEEEERVGGGEGGGGGGGRV